MFTSISPQMNRIKCTATKMGLKWDTASSQDQTFMFIGHLQLQTLVTDWGVSGFKKGACNGNGRERSHCRGSFLREVRLFYENEQHTERMWLFSLQHNMHFVLRFLFLF